MSRSALTAAAASVIATTLATVATASAGTPPPASLTHKFPLGSQTLCCQSHTATTSPTTSIKHAATASGSPRATTRHPAAGRPSTHSATHDLRAWILIALVVVVLVGVCVDRLLARRSSRNYDRRAVRYEYATYDDSPPGLPGAGDPPQRTPDPLPPRSGRLGSRSRRGRNDRKGAIPQEHEPPPLAIRRRRGS